MYILLFLFLKHTIENADWTECASESDYLVFLPILIFIISKEYNNRKDRIFLDFYSYAQWFPCISYYPQPADKLTWKAYETK